jgi:putative SOS response-associated peptidase YedK
MCGRFAITLPPEAVRGFFRYLEQPNFPPRTNIAPTQPIPVVRRDPRDAERHFVLMRWGFLPGFVKDPKDFPLIINARVETLAEKASYRNALKRRRCLVIADGYYEWLRDKKSTARRPTTSRPFLMRRPNREPMGFAGLWETWSDPHGGEIDTACIVTTPANRAASAIHDRMPAILPPDQFDAWLDAETTPAADALALLRPAPEDALQMTEISTLVNHVANDGPEVQQPLVPAVAGA